MIDKIEAAIRAEAKKRLKRHSFLTYIKQKHRSSFEKRTGLAAHVPLKTMPQSWSFHRHFDPRYCIGHSSFLAKGVWSSLQANVYQTAIAARTYLPKPAGGFRTIDAFSIPDAAVAKVFFHSLRRRNAKIFFNTSYAYQEDKTPLDAVVRVRAAVASGRPFVSQYDFASFFDSIQHDYLRGELAKSGDFLTTHMERCIIDAVISHRFKTLEGIEGTRQCGIPQGNSISLFLANVAAHSLDAKLASIGGTFARFADDSIVINDRYDDALRAADAFRSYSRQSGAAVNKEKSKGIRILSQTDSEMKTVDSIQFLSYSFNGSTVRPSDNAVSRIKKNCSRIIYNHLLLHPRRTKSFNRKRRGRGFRDWDLVTCVNELRRYIYGGYSQKGIEAFLDGAGDIRFVPGAVSYFCLAERGDVFRELDGWLLHSLHSACKERARMLTTITGKKYKSVSKAKLVSGAWYAYPALPQETRVPSFFTAWRAARKSWSRHGLGGVDAFGDAYTYAD